MSTGDDRTAPRMALADRVEALREVLDAAVLAHRVQPVEAEQREALKAEITTLFREVSAALTAAEATKNAVKALAEQWKQLNRGPEADSQARTMPGRVDHLGASTFVEKGWSMLSRNDAIGAEAAFLQALALAPGGLEAQALLSWAQMLQGRYDDAMQTLKEVLVREPQHALAHVNVGYICLRTQMYGEAIEHLSAVIRADTDRRATMYAQLYLGMVYREREMYGDAELVLRRALALGPNLLQAWYELGRAFWFAGRRADAMQAWKTGSEANKFSPWGKHCADLLGQVEQGGVPPRD
jgi:tetratricopeptide (TPR) repeat protein